MKLRFLMLFALLLSSVFVTAAEPVVFKNIPYVKDGGERQQLDLYLPTGYDKSETPIPLILIIHGGGWSAGNKDVALGFAKFYADYGIATAGINYRLRPDSQLPTQIIDCKSAVRWLRAHAKEYHLDAEHFGAWGHSAGGHLSAALGTMGEFREFDVGENLDQPSAIQAVCDFCGPADFMNYTKDEKPGPDIKGLFGGTFEEKKDVIQNSSPVHHVSAKSAPMLIIHAADDELVQFSQSQRLHESLQKNGVPSELLELPAGTGGHGSKDFSSPETRRKMLEFFVKYLKRPKIATFILGPSGRDEGRPIQELANHPEQWAAVRAKTGNLLYADHVLNRQFKDDAALTELLDKFRKQNLPLQLEVGAVKPWGATGTDCFNKQKPAWDRFLRCGAWIDGIAMDEPLNCCRDALKKEMEFAAEETATFIALVRQHYPHWAIGDIEGFPALSADELIQWIDLLETKLKQKNVRGLDFFRVDTDWMHFVHNTGRGSWKDLKRIENHCRNKKIPISIAYWAADYPAMKRLEIADDTTWYVGVMQMGFNYAAAGGQPDQIVVQSWVDAPQKIVPESEPFTFTNSARDLIGRLLKK